MLAITLAVGHFRGCRRPDKGGGDCAIRCSRYLDLDETSDFEFWRNN